MSFTRGTSLLELVITFFFVTLLLVVLAALLSSFLRARSLGGDQDARLRLIQNVESSLCAELREAASIQVLSPEVRFTKVDPLSVHLPPEFPDPAPARAPAWDPETGTVAVRYFRDNDLLVREGPSATRSTIAEGVKSFTASQTGRLIQIRLQVMGTRSSEDLTFRVHRLSR